MASFLTVYWERVVDTRQPIASRLNWCWGFVWLEAGDRAQQLFLMTCLGSYTWKYNWRGWGATTMRSLSGEKDVGVLGVGLQG